MTRNVDELGRIILPMEFREALNISTKDALEVTIDSDKIIIRKRIAGCHFCQSPETLVQIGSEYVCGECIQKLQKAKDGEVPSPVKA